MPSRAEPLAPRLALGGLSFAIDAPGGLSAEERTFCAERAVPGYADAPDFTLRIEPGWPGRLDPGQFADRAPARVEARGAGRLQVGHRRFLAELDSSERRGTLHREPQSGGLAISLRVALCALLPETSGLPLHAAGVVLDGSGLAFFGVSGAGKSTLAGTAPGAVLSDELVVLRSEPWRVLPSGFWGEAELPGTACGAPLRALVQLSKTARFEFEPLTPRPALQGLLGTILVPPDTALWNLALRLAHRLVREVPVYRLGYALGASPWDELRARLSASPPIEASA